MAYATTLSCKVDLNFNHSNRCLTDAIPSPGEELEAARSATTARPHSLARENRATRGVPEKATAQVLVSRRDPSLVSQAFYFNAAE